MVVTAKDLRKDYPLGFHDVDISVFRSAKGLSPEVVAAISADKQEPEWMLKYRLKALDHFLARPMPTWGPDLSHLDFDNIYYYVKPVEEQSRTWEDVPESIKQTFEKIGVPEAERKYLGGVSNQYDSNVVYHSIREDLEKQGVLFSDCDTGLREHPEIFRKYFGTIIPSNDNKFAALNSACWSGGSFVYVPPGVHVEVPLQAYFRINSDNMGQFERTLIIADEGSSVHYIEGCLPGNELVLDANGTMVPIESIMVGDKVFDQNGQRVRVKAIQVRDYQGPLHTFMPVSPGNAFKTTSEHPIRIVPRSEVLTKRKPRKTWKAEVNTNLLLHATPRWVPAQDVQPGDFLVFPKLQPKLAEPLSLELARLVGYFLAEGSASLANGHKCLQFSFQIKEVEYVEEVRRLCKSLYGSRGSVTYVESKNAATVAVFTKVGYDTMKALVGTRSWNKKLAPDLVNQSEEFLSNLVETYMFGDGNLTNRGSNQWWRASTTSKLWAFQLQSILARLGTYATIRQERKAGPGIILGRNIVRHALYQIQWTIGPRYTNLVRDAGDYFLVPIQKITTELYTGLVHNLDVESPDSYLASGFAVHNCSAPTYSSDSLHSAVVELIALPGSKIRYTTIQNWSSNVYNLVTKRAAAYDHATVEWVDFNTGAGVTMKYPSVYLLGEYAHAEIISAAFAGEGQHQDTGGKAIHVASHTTSNINARSISMGNGQSSYRGHIKVVEKAQDVKINVRCDALLLDPESQTNTYPYMDVESSDVEIGHEASVSKVGEEQLFYLRARGLSESEATAMIVNGFFEPMARELPMEYAVELNRILALSMEGAIG